MTHICVSELASIGSDNGLSPRRRQAIIRINAGILLIRTLGAQFNEIFYRNSYIFIEENALENVVWKMAAILFRPQYVKIITKSHEDIRNFISMSRCKRDTPRGIAVRRRIQQSWVLCLFDGCYTISVTQYDTGLIQSLHKTNERRRYFVTTSLNGWVQESTSQTIHSWVYSGCW